MKSNPATSTGHVTARAAIVLVALYLALGVGAPWLLRDAPPVAQDVIATAAYDAAAMPHVTSPKKSANAR
jgi:hypothetical protein